MKSRLKNQIKIVDIVEKILQLNKQNQEGQRLNIIV